MSAGLIFHFATSNKPAFPVINAEHGNFVRGRRVMLDAELAKLYASQLQVCIRRLNAIVNVFPEIFMFRLGLKAYGVQKSGGHEGRRFAPYAFTEPGMAMLSSVLRSQRAAQVNAAIMRTFVRVREMLSSHQELRHKIDAMEKRYIARFQAVFETIRRMLETP